MKTPLRFVILAILVNALSCSPKQGEVFFIPTLHGYHNVNQNYDYNTLNSIIAKLKPDVIAVEIRPEDIAEDSMYVAYNYPYEMYAVKTWFPNVKIVGIDWLGNDIEGKLIPFDYWQTQSELKKIEQKLSIDSLFLNKLKVCNSRYIERDSLLRHCSLEQLLNSTDAEITNEYYACLKAQLNGSPYELLVTCIDKRNDKILENITAVIDKNRGKRIVILTGDDHYIVLKDKFEHSKIYNVNKQ